jgi:hypothetical protein
MEDDIEDDFEDAERFDPSLYPRSYRISLRWMLVILACGAVLTLGGLFGLAYFSLTYAQYTAAAALFLMALCTAFFCLGLYGLLCGLQYRVILEAESIELIEPFRRRSLRHDEIQGLRVFPGGHGLEVLVLVPRDARIKQVKIPMVLKTDDAFHLWFSNIAHLDVKEALQSKDELYSTFYPELPPEERFRRIEHLRRLGAWMNGGTIALSFGSFVLPDPGHLLSATLAALPWLAIILVARFQPLYRFAGSRNDERVDLTLPLMLPGCALTWDALFTFNTLEWQGPLMLACAGGFALTGVAARIDPWFRDQRWGVLATGLFACAYGFGTGMEFNALADRSTPEVYRVKVHAKYVSESSHVPTWYLTVEPWGPVADSEDISVSKAQYQLTKPGDTVCVLLKSGALKIAWYRVEPCVDPDSRSPAVPRAQKDLTLYDRREHHRPERISCLARGGRILTACSAR